MTSCNTYPSYYLVWTEEQFTTLTPFTSARDTFPRLVSIWPVYLTPESVDLWFKIINFSDYKFNIYGRENIKMNAGDLVNIILEKSAADHVDLIDLGVGSAVKDYYLLEALLEKMPQDGQRMNYVPLDYSIAILQRVMDYTEDLMDAYPNKLHIEAVLGDFYRLVRYRHRINDLSISPKVFALLGNILGNADEF